MTLQEIMDAARARVEITDGPTFTTSDDGWEHNAYRFRLTIADEMLISNAPYCAGTGLAAPADPVDVFGSIVSDVQSVAPYMETRDEMDRNVDAQTRQACAPGFAPAGWEDWASDMGAAFEMPRAAVQSMRAFQEMVARASLLRERLAPDVWTALIDVEV